MWERLKQWFAGRTRAQAAGQEADVQHDPAQPDTGHSAVGRASGDGSGYAGETGAERRAEQGR